MSDSNLPPRAFLPLVLRLARQPTTAPGGPRVVAEVHSAVLSPRRRSVPGGYEKPRSGINEGRRQAREQGVSMISILSLSLAVQMDVRELAVLLGLQAPEGVEPAGTPLLWTLPKKGRPSEPIAESGPPHQPPAPRVMIRGNTLTAASQTLKEEA